MNLLLRRVATLLLLLAVPLRVFAAVAMTFCPPPADAMHQVHTAPVQIHEQSVMTMTESDNRTDGSMVHGDHHDHDAGGADAHRHLSCGSCCCAGMISTAQYEWQPHPFARPATPSFVQIAVPNTVPHRLERPPRTSLA